MASHFLLLVASAVAPAVANAFQLRSSTDISRGNIAPALFESLKKNLNARDDSSTFQSLIDSSETLCSAVSDSNMTSVDAAFTTALNGLNSNNFAESTLAISDMSSVISALSEAVTDIKAFNGLSTKDTQTILQYITSVSTNMQSCLEASVSSSQTWSNQTDQLSNVMLTTANSVTNILAAVGQQMITHGYCTTTNDLSAVSSSIAALNKAITSTASSFGYTATTVDSALDASDLKSLVKVSTAPITTQTTSLKAVIDIVNTIIKNAMVKAFGSVIRRDNAALTDSINMMVDGVAGYLSTITTLMTTSDTSTVISNSSGLGDVLTSLTNFLASTSEYDMTAADYAAIASSVESIDAILATLEEAIASSGLNCGAIAGLSTGLAALQAEISSLASNIGFTPTSGKDTCASATSSSSSVTSTTTSSSASSSDVSSNWNTSSSDATSSSTITTTSIVTTSSAVTTSSTEVTTSSTTTTTTPSSTTTSTSTTVAPETSSSSSSDVESSTSTTTTSSTEVVPTTTTTTTTTSSTESPSSTSTTSESSSTAVSTSSTQDSTSVVPTVTSSSTTTTSTTSSTTSSTSSTTSTTSSSTTTTSSTTITSSSTSSPTVSVSCPTNGSVIGTVCFIFTSQYLDTAVSCPKSNGLWYGNSCFYGSSMASSLCTAGYYYSGSCYTPNAGARVAERGNYIFNALAVVLGAFL